MRIVDKGMGGGGGRLIGLEETGPVWGTSTPHLNEGQKANE